MNVRWTDPAIAQLEDIFEYISHESEESARQLIGRIVRRSQQIGDFPFAGRTVPEYQLESVREVLEPPYRLIYLIASESVDVVAVIHGARQLPGLPE